MQNKNPTTTSCRLHGNRKIQKTILLRPQALHPPPSTIPWLQITLIIRKLLKPNSCSSREFPLNTHLKILISILKFIVSNYESSYIPETFNYWNRIFFYKNQVFTVISLPSGKLPTNLPETIFKLKPSYFLNNLCLSINTNTDHWEYNWLWIILAFFRLRTENNIWKYCHSQEYIYVFLHITI